VLDDLRQKLDKAGYEVEYATEFMAALYPVIWIGRRWTSSRGRRRANATELAMNELHVNSVANSLLRALLALEEPWIRRRKRLPIGTSILVVARKRP
jgi:hypothetical protein